MTNELINSGATIETGRKIINTLLSGSTSTLSTSGISFSNIHVSSTITASTLNATSILSGGTNLYSVFLPIGGGGTFSGGTVTGLTTFTAGVNSSGITGTTLVYTNATIRGIIGSNLTSSPAWEFAVASGQTTGNTALEIGYGDKGQDRTYSFDFTIAARQTAGAAGTVGDSKYWKVQALIRADVVGSSTLLGYSSTTIGSSAGASAWGVTPTGDGSFPGGYAILLVVTGATNKTITWAAHGNCSTIF